MPQTLKVRENLNAFLSEASCGRALARFWDAAARLAEMVVKYPLGWRVQCLPPKID
jgi:hypothetical protein